MNKLYHYFQATSEGGADMYAHCNLTAEELFDSIYLWDRSDYFKDFTDNPSDEECLEVFNKIVEDIVYSWDTAYVSFPDIYTVEGDKLVESYPSDEEIVTYIKTKLREWKEEN